MNEGNKGVFRSGLNRRFREETTDQFNEGMVEAKHRYFSEGWGKVKRPKLQQRPVGIRARAWV